MMVVATPAVASASHATSVEPIGERLVTTDFAAYAAAGDRVLYQPKGDASALKLYDLKNRTERSIPVPGKVLSLALSDSHAAYTTVESVRGQDRYSLWLHDLQTDQRISAAEGVWEMSDPRLAGGKLLWRSGGALTVLDIASHGLTTLPSYSQFLKFDGRFAVQTYGDELAVTDVATRNEARHTLPVAARTYGDLSYGRLVYVGKECTYNQESVYLYNLVTRQQREIGQQFCGGPAPALLGNVAGLINNEQSPTGYNPSAVKVVQLETGRSAEPMMDMETKSDPRLTGNYIVYTEGERLLSVALNLQYPMSDSIAPVYHTVAAGESLWQIARANRVRLPDLVHANNLLRPEAIEPGARLLLPNPVSPRYDSYTVQSGDTLFRLAARFSTTVRSIAALNHLENPDSLLVGQVLQIARGPEETGDAEWIAQSYAVAPGDTLWQIAQRAGVSMQALVAQNGLTNPDQIQAGTQLVIRPRAWYRYQ